MLTKRSSFIALSSSLILASAQLFTAQASTPEKAPLISQEAASPAPAAPEQAPAPAESPAAETSTESTEVGDIIALASENENLTTLVEAITAAELVETLQGEGPFTVFAPTNEAFAALPPEDLENLLQPENKDKLIQVLTYHVIPQALPSTELESGDLETVEGSQVTVTVEGETVKVGEATVTQADITASNGVIHLIDQVLMPAE